MTVGPGSPDAAVATVVAEVARLRLGLPGAAPPAVRPFWPGVLDGFWVVPTFDDRRGRVTVVMTVSGSIAAHAGLDRAAARLRELDVLERPADVISDFRPILDAVGGLTPGYPRYPSDTVARTPSGGVCLVLSEPPEWVAYAAGGAAGPPPAEPGGGGAGLAPRATPGTMTCELSPDYRLTWSYEVAGELLGRFDGDPDHAVPDVVDGMTAERVIASARSVLRSPLAVPSAPVALATAPARFRVELLGLGPVSVDDPPASGRAEV